jgi:DnaK suppressor protein
MEAPMTQRETSGATLTTEQIAQLRQLLEDKRATLAHHEGPRAREARGDQPDPMDAATDATDDDERVLLSEHERTLLRQIDDALERIAEGTYGTSERSGEWIGFARLRAVPWARLTVAEAEDDERR